MFHGWKIEYLFQGKQDRDEKKLDINRVVIITGEYKFSEAEERFRKLVKDAKRIVSIDYIGETLGVFLDQTI